MHNFSNQLYGSPYFVNIVTLNFSYVLWKEHFILIGEKILQINTSHIREAAKKPVIRETILLFFFDGHSSDGRPLSSRGGGSRPFFVAFLTFLVLFALFQGKIRESLKSFVSKGVKGTLETTWSFYLFPYFVMRT